LLVFLLFATGAMTIALWALAALVGLVSAPPIVVVGGLVALVVVSAGALMAARGFRSLAAPVDDLVEAADRIQAGDYSVAVPERGARPMRSLVRAFNGMAARLAAVDTQRREFLADAAHELRTPVAVIAGQLAAIEDGVYPADAEHLGPINEQLRALERLIEDLRTVALAEAGSLSLSRQPTDLAELAGDAASAFRAQASAAGVELAVAAAEGLPLLALDPVRVNQVIANLLANAIRHTPAGGRVTLGVRRDGDWAVVEVADTGEGIPADLLPRVFERFVKGVGSSGSGLGLAIARDLVEAHGGTISVASRAGEGTSVTFRLPIGM
jgi:two-component system sensor histidine kinase BaeS